MGVIHADSSAPLRQVTIICSIIPVVDGCTRRSNVYKSDRTQHRRRKGIPWRNEDEVIGTILPHKLLPAEHIL